MGSARVHMLCKWNVISAQYFNKLQERGCMGGWDVGGGGGNT